MDEFAIVLVTTSSLQEAEKITNALVEEKLAACGNIVKGITSIYTWNDKLCKDEEVLILFKTKRKKFNALSKRVKELHSYEVPEIIAIPIIDGWKDYLDWVAKST
ncbi:divalent-cation tolerance protein CutA [bacterium]|nr:divalent-cation tolerance protein CutA [bacterium]